MRLNNLIGKPIVIVFSVGAFAQQGGSNLPSCAESCVTRVTSGTQIGGCELTDFACLCRSKSFLDDIGCCLTSNCDTADQQKAGAELKDFCGAVGVEIPAAFACKGNSISSVLGAIGGELSSSTTRSTTSISSSITSGSSGSTSSTRSVVLTESTTSPSSAPPTTISTSSTTTISGSPDPTSSLPNQSGSTGNTGGTGGFSTSGKIAVGVAIPIVFILGALGLTFFLWRRRKRQSSDDSTTPELHGETKHMSELAGAGKGGTFLGAGNTRDGEIKESPTTDTIEKSELMASSPTNGNSMPVVHEAPDNRSMQATLSGPPIFEIADSEPHKQAQGYGVSNRGEVEQTREMSATPRLAPVIVASSGATSPRSPTSPIVRKELPASPVFGFKTPYSPLAEEAAPSASTGMLEKDSVEQERVAIKRRQTEIIAERERLRVRELEREELELQRRLDALSGDGGRPGVGS